MNRKNRRSLRRGDAIRQSDLHSGKDRGKKGAGKLLPLLADQPATGPVDPHALAAELARLAELARRGFST
jgi:hypothetical protein